MGQHWLVDLCGTLMGALGLPFLCFPMFFIEALNRSRQECTRFERENQEAVKLYFGMLIAVEIIWLLLGSWLVPNFWQSV